MKCLLDASIVLWSVAAKHKLSSRAVQVLSSDSSTLYLSSATAWEIAIKYALGNLPLHMQPAAFIAEVVRGLGLKPLDITFQHAIEAAQLPNHHRDPFDRMLIAQAKTENIVLLTADRIFEKYKLEQIYCGK